MATTPCSYPYKYSLLPRWRSSSPIPFSAAVSGRRRSPLAPIILALASFLVIWQFWRLYLFEPSAGTYCDPWSSYGRLSVNRDVPEENIWRPFGPPPWPNKSEAELDAQNAQGQCAPPPLFRALRESLSIRSDSLTPYPAGVPEHLLPFLHNRTVLLVGDSVSREIIQQFCSLVKKQVIKVERGHQWDLSAQIPEEWIPKEWADHENWDGWMREKENTSRPRLCYVPEWDFLVVNIFHFGLDDTEYWRTKDQYNPPSLLEHRMRAIAAPLLERLAVPSSEGGLAPHARSSTPDLVELSSALWDLAKWAREDIDAHETTITDLSPSRLQWYRRRVQDTLLDARALWPKTKLVWRTSHWPSDQSAKIDWFMGWSWDNPDAHRPFFHHNRLLQLDHAARSVLLPQEWHVKDRNALKAWKVDARWRGVDEVGWSQWGNLLLGQHAHQQDQLHPGPLPAAYLWADMMLYELRDATGFPRLELVEPLPPADK